MIKKISVLGSLFALMIAGCSPAPVPDVESQHPEQKITTIQTHQLDKIQRFGKMLEDLNVRPIYIYIDKDGSRNMSGAGAGELPPTMRRLLTSILVDFGPKVKVVDNTSVAVKMITSAKTSGDIYILDGAITMYDKNIMVQSSGFNLGLDFGGGKTATNSNTDTKDKDKLSMLGVDFYLRQNGIIEYKTSGKIDMRVTSRGYNFGVSINNAGIGMSGYKTIKDGAGLSVRKLLQESMYNLIKQIIRHRNRKI